MECSTVLIIFTGLIITTVQAQPCPTSECTCQTSIEGGPNQGRTIYCKGRNLNTIPTFTSTTEVFYELTLVENNIRDISDNAFNGLNVEKIDLRQNNINSISDYAFNGTENTLEQLLLEAERLPFPEDELRVLTKLTMLHLQKFSIPELPSGAFSHMTSLQTLRLEDCRISTVHTTAFSGLENRLRELDLTLNTFPNIPSAINTLRELRILRLAQTPIQIISNGTFSNLVNLLDLELLTCNVQLIKSSAFQGLASLTYLGLTDNSLDENVINEIGTLHNLEQLELSGNEIKQIPDNFFIHLNKLAFLNLARNKLSLLSQDTLAGLENELHTLILSDNEITSIADTPSAFSKFDVLEELRLDNQDLSNTLNTETFKGLNNLRVLNLQSVGFQSRHWPVVQAQRELRELRLNKNQIDRIDDDNFQYMNKLEILDMSENSITTFTQRNLKGLENSLKQFTLDNNQILTADRCVFHEFSQLSKISLDSNPLHCDCNLRWLREWLPVIGTPFVSWKCATPPAHANKVFTDIQPDDFTCSNENSTQTTTFAPCPSFKITTAAPITTPITTPPSTTPATTTQSTTKPTTPAPTTEIPRGLQITDVGRAQDSLEITWSIENADDINNFRVRHRVEDSSSNFISSPSIHIDVTMYKITGLTVETSYEVCVDIEDSVGTVFGTECLFTSTKPVESGSTDGSKADPLAGIIAGGVVGGVLLLAIIIGGIIAVVYYSRKKQPPKGGASIRYDNNELGGAGYNSKGYPQEHGAMGGDKGRIFIDIQSNDKTKINNNMNNRLHGDRTSDPRYVHSGPIPAKQPDAYFNAAYRDPRTGADGYLAPSDQRPDEYFPPHTNRPESYLAPSEIQPANTMSYDGGYHNPVGMRAEQDERGHYEISNTALYI